MRHFPRNGLLFVIVTKYVARQSTFSYSLQYRWTCICCIFLTIIATCNYDKGQRSSCFWFYLYFFSHNLLKVLLAPQPLCSYTECWGPCGNLVQRVVIG